MFKGVIGLWVDVGWPFSLAGGDPIRMFLILIA